MQTVFSSRRGTNAGAVCGFAWLRLAALLFAARHHAEAKKLLPYAVLINLYVAGLDIFHLAALLIAHHQIERDLRAW